MENLRILRTMFRKLIPILYLMLLGIGGCAALIGPRVEYTNWDCGVATEETRVAVCTGGYFSYDNFRYSGSVRPINYSEAIPDGWGTLSNIATGETNRVKFYLGRATEISNQIAGERAKFSGKIDGNFRWLEGTYDTDVLQYRGSFRTDGGWKKGKVFWKKSGDSFEGSFRKALGPAGNGNRFPDQNYPHIGKYNLVSRGCNSAQTIEGTFTRNQSPHAISLSAPFVINSNGSRVKYRRLSGSNRSIEVSLKDGRRLTVDDPQIEIDANNQLRGIRSTDPFMGYDGGLGAIGFYSMEWLRIFDCTSGPTLALEKSLLPQTGARHILHDVGSNLSELEAWGFKKTYKTHGPNIPTEGQIFIAKVLDFSPDRKVNRAYEQSSRFVSSTYQRHNPAYDVARLEMETVARELVREEAEVAEFQANCVAGFWECVLASALIDGTPQLEKSLEAKKNKLRSTPTTITEKVYSDYSIQKLDITASKSGAVVVALIDFDRGVTYVDEIPFSETSTFTVVNSPIHRSDNNAASIKRGSSSEREIDSWMRQAPKFNKDLSTLLTNLVTNTRANEVSHEIQLQQVTNWSAGVRMPRTYADDSSRKAKQGFSIGDTVERPSDVPQQNPSNYKLEDSIVVVNTLSGSGSGFYVSPTMIITNAHVVGDSNFVRMRDFDGREVTGEVFKKDLGSDLALVSVSRSAIPLKFSKGCQVNRREEVFTIGHPKGYEYSTSRGIVSSVRKMKNPFVPVAGEFRYVQIDAPISQGNSGGPLFNGSGEVIGVNTWGNTAGQNLNFAVHCEEIVRFLN